ncbi:MAG: potassium channel protein [Acidimicrobiia bacterium]|nr:potassium channel protein [Acidimicrobiia bacterium]MDH5293468.1 potassium channel protein [Acidimicrobiia bacterium]
MTARARVGAGVAGLLLLTIIGTSGYVAIEGASTFEALWMVLITITTVGYGLVFPLSTAGQVLTIVIMVSGVGLLFYTAGSAIEQLFLYRTERRSGRMVKMAQGMSGHVILCGLGRVGVGTMRSLEARGVDVVIIEADPDRAAAHRDEGSIVIEGDATHNDALVAAGLHRARALVACVTNDADNLVIVLSARALAPDLHIVSRASEAEWEDKLRLAGADRVVAPQVVGSERLAAMAVERNLADIFDVVVGGRALEFVVEEVVVAAGSLLIGQAIRDTKLRETSGAMVLAVEDPSRQLLTTATPGHVLEEGSTVILVGTPDQVDAAAHMLRP